jgi:hypothetical protein
VLFYSARFAVSGAILQNHLPMGFNFPAPVAGIYEPGKPARGAWRLSRGDRSNVESMMNAVNDEKGEGRVSSSFLASPETERRASGSERWDGKSNLAAFVPSDSASN